MRHLRDLLSLDLRLSELEALSCKDAEEMHNHRWKWMAARQRIANRKPEIERLRKEMWG